MYYRLDENNNVVPTTLNKLELPVSVGRTTIGPWLVSTVFMAVDHNFYGEGPPIVFETMVFDVDQHGMMDQYADRYTTYRDAIAGHEFAVNVCKEALDKNKSNLYTIADGLRSCMKEDE